MLLNLLHEAKDTHRFYFLFSDRGDAASAFKGYGKLCESPVERFPVLKKILRGPLASLRDVIRYMHTRWTIFKIQPDLLYVNSMAITPSVRAACDASAIPLVLHAHEMDFMVACFQSGARVNKLIRRSSRFISCANAVAAFYEDWYNLPREKSEIIYGPVSNERFLKRKNIIGQQDSCTPDPAAITVGVVAQLSFLKSPDHFIRALSIVKGKAKSKVRFAWLGVLPGNKDLLANLRSLSARLSLENDIRFYPVSGDVFDFYQHIDIFVLPSRAEGFPISILEAMLSEKPVVAMDVGGIREAIDAQTGYLVRDRTPEGLAEGILHLLDNRDKWAGMGENGKKRVMENFEAAVQAPKWLKIIAGAIGRPRAAEVPYGRPVN